MSELVRTFRASVWSMGLAVACVVAVTPGCGSKTKDEQPPPRGQPVRADTASQTALREAAKFLVGQKSEDGNWYSTTYGKFNQHSESVAPTALVVYALAHLPDELRKEHEPAMREALDRLRGRITERGFIGNVHGAAHYPTYVTGMVLATYGRLGWELPESDRAAMIRYIESAQLNHTRGWTADDGHFGGWDLVGDQMIERQVHGPGTNISVTSFALEGLAPVLDDVSESTQLTAMYWLIQLQQQSTDGGFAFGPDPNANKAGLVNEKNPDAKLSEDATPKLRSYGSATCDGLRSLAYLKAASGESNPGKEAEQWLLRHDNIETVPGFEDTDAPAWQHALYYYYTMSLAKVYRLYPQTGSKTRRHRLASHLVKLQKPDGSWVNKAKAMREDDPLIATAFAIIAIAEATADDE